MWDGRVANGASVATGVYVCELRACAEQAARRFVIVR
jgi:hypothetical protein